MRTAPRLRRASAVVVPLLLVASLAAAPVPALDEYDGVQPAALDQPRVNLALRRSL